MVARFSAWNWNNRTCRAGLLCKKEKTVYFASSFTAADKGKITCASDPTIDNFVKFAGSCVVHDGYEFSRQDKVHNIVEFSNKNGIKVPLRVCWKSTGGKNCCQCEKCWRTILELIAEGASAENYDLNYNYKQLKSFHKLFYDKKIYLNIGKAAFIQKYKRQ